MTPAETIEAAKLMQEWAQSVIDGKPIEIEGRPHGTTEWFSLNTPSWNCGRTEFRRKTQPRRVPLEAKDVPPGSVLRPKGSLGWANIRSVNVMSDGVNVEVEACGYLLNAQALATDYEISRDNGKTWKPCWNEVVE